MALIYIPCLNVDAPDDGVSFSPGIIPGQGGDGGTTLSPGVTISHPDIPFTLGLSPFGPALFIGINFRWWADLFGLGETRIQREKEQIQDVYTPIFRFLHNEYGYPLRDGHALQFESEYVERMFAEDDFKRRSAEGMYQEASVLAQSVFVDDSPTTGQRKRIVNQFLANAHINEWPENAWIYAWRGLVESANPDCRKEKARWIKNPKLVDDAARFSVLLHYMPLANFASAVAEHKVGDKGGRKLLTAWLNNPQLVAGIPQVLEIPPWAVAYKSPEAGGGQSGNPYETQQIAEREPIQRLWEKVNFQRPWYPDLIYLSPQGLVSPTLEVPPAQKPDGWDQQDPIPPWPGDNVVEIPPVLPGPQNWPQYPDCPPWNQQPQGETPPGEQDPGDLDPQQPDGLCDPDCQAQIDYLLDRVQFLDNMNGLGIIPRLENLEHWVTDLERRIPGPMPPLPNPNPYPPWLPPPPIDPGDDIDNDGIPDVEVPPLFDPECVEYLKKLCDPLTRCEELQKCERELECVEVPFCDEFGGPWGGMAECWLKANTPDVGEDLDPLQGRTIPRTLGDYVLAAHKQSRTNVISGQIPGSGGGQQQNLQSSEGRLLAVAQASGDFFYNAWKGGDIRPVPPPVAPIEPLHHIFVDPESTAGKSIKFRQPKLREGEVDPCSEETF